MNLNLLITNNYESLSKVAKLIACNKSGDLISETYSNIAEKEIPYPLNNLEFIKFFSRCMKNRYVWGNSSFNKLHRPKESLSLDNENRLYAYENDRNTFLDLIIDNEAVKNIELSVEETNEVTKEFIDISSSLGKSKTLKYLEVLDFKNDLLEYEKILFELYFEKDMSTRQIAVMYSDSIHKMNYQSVNTMVNIIKQKIKNTKWKY